MGMLSSMIRCIRRVFLFLRSLHLLSGSVSRLEVDQSAGPLFCELSLTRCAFLVNIAAFFYQVSRAGGFFSSMVFTGALDCVWPFPALPVAFIDLLPALCALILFHFLSYGPLSCLHSPDFRITRDDISPDLALLPSFLFFVFCKFLISVSPSLSFAVQSFAR